MNTDVLESCAERLLSAQSLQDVLQHPSLH